MRKYITMQGDMWDTISLRFYGDEKFADIIMRENSEYRDTYVFPAGIELQIPDIDTSDEVENIPPWRAVRNER